MITFQLETWKQFYEDAPSLWVRIMTEMKDQITGAFGQEQINPDVEAYQRLDDMGRLIIVTARDGKKLVGYATSAIQQHPHFTQTKIGFGDTTYLLPEYRKGLTGMKLFRMTEKLMKELGVKRYLAPVFGTGAMEAIFKRMGFTAEHTIYSKWIGD